MLNLLSVLGLSLALLPASPREGASVVAANNQFAVDLYGRLGSREGNLFFSPYSISKALAMTYAGARGDTEQEMAAVLHFTLGQEKEHRAFLEMRNLLNRNHPAMTSARSPRKPIPQLWVSANLWGQRGYGFRKAYLDLLRDCYGAGLQEVDFATAPERARKTINDWVERQTNRKIRDLLSSEAVHAETRLVLASAIYFKGDWATPFAKSATSPEMFRVNARREVQAPMMKHTDEFGYFEDKQLQGLRMMYQGDDLAMLVLLPKQVEGLAALEKALTADNLKTWMAKLRTQKVDVTLPKFRMTDEFALKDTLMELGMRKAFSRAADFRGMNDAREPLRIDAVSHKAFVEVNEEGAEAAAATAVSVGLATAPPPMISPPTPVFRADHPFVFAICDVQTGLILFLGRVTNP